MLYSQKILKMSPSVTLAITAKAKKMKDEGLDVISFGVGEPDFNTPDYIQEAAIKAIRQGMTKYTPTSGIPELKSAIIDKFKKENNLTYKESQVIISVGAKQCLSNVFQAILNPGDEVIMPLPCWVSYPELVKLYDGIPVYVHTKEKEQFKYDMDSLNSIVTNQTKAIIINSPNNPTGTVYTREELESIAEFAQKHDLLIISDEIYEKLIYGDEEHISIASLSSDAYSRTIVINGVSKTYAMTGWRIGYAAGSETIIKLMSNIQSHTTSNPTSISQYASVEALRGELKIIEAMIKEFGRRRDRMVEGINSIGTISCLKPAGAFYVMVNISKLIGSKFNGNVIKDSVDLSSFLLEEEKLAVIPGAAFGVDNYIRLSYATSMENIERGLKRLESFINKIEK